MLKSKAIAKELVRLAQTRGIGPSALAESFIRYAKERNLMYLVSNVVLYLEVFGKEAKENSELNITFAREADKETVEKIRSYTKAPEGTEAVVSLDPELIGGFIASRAGKTYDGSIKTRLDKLRKTLATAN